MQAGQAAVEAGQDDVAIERAQAALAAQQRAAHDARRTLELALADERTQSLRLTRDLEAVQAELAAERAACRAHAAEAHWT